MLKRRHRVTVYAKDSHAKVSKQGGSRVTSRHVVCELVVDERGVVM
jgi:hypothetical protein